MIDATESPLVAAIERERIEALRRIDQDFFDPQECLNVGRAVAAIESSPTKAMRNKLRRSMFKVIKGGRQ